MKVTQKKDNFNDIMSIASLCGYIVFSLFRIFTENNKLMLIPFFLVGKSMFVEVNFVCIGEREVTKEGAFGQTKTGFVHFDGIISSQKIL